MFVFDQKHGEVGRGFFSVVLNSVWTFFRRREGVMDELHELLGSLKESESMRGLLW